MQYLKVETGVWVEYDPDTKISRTIVKAEVNSEIDFLKAQRDALAQPLTDAEYLAWGKENYPTSGQETSRKLLTARINELQAIKEKLI